MDMENWYNQNIFGATTQLSVIPNLCIAAVYLGLQEYFRTVAEKGLEKKIKSIINWEWDCERWESGILQSSFGDFQGIVEVTIFREVILDYDICNLTCQYW